MPPKAPRIFVWALALVAAPRSARADVWTDVASLLERLEYDDAVARLAPVAADVERPARDRLRALELVAVAHVGAGRDDQARETFAKLHAGDPGWTLQDRTYSPKIRGLFASAAPPASAAPVAVTLEAAPTGEAEVTIVARFDANVVYADALELRFRWAGEGPWSTSTGVREPAGASFRVPRPAGVPGVSRLRAVAQVKAPSGQVVARAGTDEAPVVLEVRANAPAVGAPAVMPGRASGGGSIFGRWWFWTAAGVLVAGGITAAIVVAGGGDDRPSASLGSQTMR